MFGGLGGGAWAIERDSGIDEMASLYELQLGVGLATHDGSSEFLTNEIVYLFDRRLEYASSDGDYDIGPTVMLRCVQRY